ncbi:MAG: ABC transporter permease [Herpetosiphon sp.]
MGLRLSRARLLGGVGVIIALLLAFGVSRSVKPGSVSTLTIPYAAAAPGAAPLIAFHLPTIATVVVLQAVLGLLGALLVVRQPARWAGTYMSTVIGATLFTLLIWAIAGEGTDVVDVLARVVRLATPITLGALAGLICERSGVVNIGIEGMMLFGACAAYITTIVTDHAALGVGVAVLVGGLVAALHAWLSISFRIDQIISGTVINILAIGTTGFLRGSFITSYRNPRGAQLPTWSIPGLSKIPVIGPVLFNHQPITYLMLVGVVVVHVLLFRSVWGLRTRAIGEHPKAAGTVGINVNRLRAINVVIGGLIAGLAGAWFSLEATFRFDDYMTNGRGFIALAAMIFGKWTPFGAFGGALLFSSAEALQIRIQGFTFALPPQFLQMLPYLVTMVVLAGVVGKARPPAAVGKPYDG